MSFLRLSRLRRSFCSGINPFHVRSSGVIIDPYLEQEKLMKESENTSLFSNPKRKFQIWKITGQGLARSTFAAAKIKQFIKENNEGIKITFLNHLFLI